MALEPPPPMPIALILAGLGVKICFAILTSFHKSGTKQPSEEAYEVAKDTSALYLES
jgi:hypothetical protein